MHHLSGQLLSLLLAAALFAIALAVQVLVSNMVVGVGRLSIADLNERLPTTVRTLLAGIIVGLLAHLVLKRIGIELASIRQSLALIRDTLISASIFLTAVLIVEHIRRSVPQGAPVKGIRLFGSSIGPLLWPSTLGAVGLGFGALAGAVVASIFWHRWVDQVNTLTHERWSLAGDWVTGVTNGWIGDSSTQIPFLTYFESREQQDRPGLFAKHSYGMAPVLVLDWAVTIIWFHFAARLAAGKKEMPPTARVDRPLRGFVILESAVIGLVAAVGLYLISTHPVIRASFWRPILVILLFLCVASLGVARAKRLNDRVSTRLRNKMLSAALGGFGVGTGLQMMQSGMVFELASLLVLGACAFGALASHVLFLWICHRRGYDRGLLAVASMCAIGGLATAPEVGRVYTEHLQGREHEAGASSVVNFEAAAYIAALWCNVLSLPLSLLVWQAFAWV